MSGEAESLYSARVIDLKEHLGPKTPKEVGPLRGGGGGGTFEDMTWQDAVRRVDDKVDDNFKWILGVFGAGFMALLIAFASGFLVLSDKIDKGNDRIVTKLDAISAQVSDVKTDVAVLKATAPVKKP